MNYNFYYALDVAEMLKLEQLAYMAYMDEGFYKVLFSEYFWEIYTKKNLPFYKKTDTWAKTFQKWYRIQIPNLFYVKCPDCQDELLSVAHPDFYKKVIGVWATTRYDYEKVLEYYCRFCTRYYMVHCRCVQSNYGKENGERLYARGVLSKFLGWEVSMGGNGDVRPNRRSGSEELMQALDEHHDVRNVICISEWTMREYPDEMEPFMMYYVGDRNIYYMGIGNGEPLPNGYGGYRHYWKCEVCNEINGYKDR